MRAEQLGSFERDELSPAEAVVFNDILQVFISRVVAKEHSFGRDPQEALDEWIESNASKYEQAFNEMLDEKPELVTDQSYASQEAAIKYIEEKLG